MSLPFTRDQFLDAFADYNESVWPLAVVLWVLTAAALALLGRDAGERRAINSLLAVHWAWAAIVYHASFFSRINPAAIWFAALFLTEAGLIVWFGIVRDDLRYGVGTSRRLVLARALIAYALIYPAVVWLEGFTYPWMPTFGVPCPTTILTIGFLLAATPPLPFAVIVIPLAWAIIGGSAVFALDVRADLMLIAAGGVLAAHAATSAVARRRVS